MKVLSMPHFQALPIVQYTKMEVGRPWRFNHVNDVNVSS